MLCISLKLFRQDKGITDDLRHVLVVFWIGGALKALPRVPNGSQWTTKCAMRSLDEMFYCGMISLWENRVLQTKVDKGISEEYRHVLVVFRQ